MATETYDWEGLSGKSYKYYIYQAYNFKAEPGNYIFAFESPSGGWIPIYIGETSDLSERFDNHHKAQCIRDHGATHIHVHLSSDDENVRLEEEKDLIGLYQPPCNGQTAFY